MKTILVVGVNDGQCTDNEANDSKDYCNWNCWEPLGDEGGCRAEEDSVHVGFHGWNLTEECWCSKLPNHGRALPPPRLKNASINFFSLLSNVQPFPEPKFIPHFRLSSPFLSLHLLLRTTEEPTKHSPNQVQ